MADIICSLHGVKFFSLLLPFFPLSSSLPPNKFSRSFLNFDISIDFFFSNQADGG